MKMKVTKIYCVNPNGDWDERGPGRPKYINYGEYIEVTEKQARRYVRPGRFSLTNPRKVKKKGNAKDGEKK